MTTNQTIRTRLGTYTPRNRWRIAALGIALASFWGSLAFAGPPAPTMKPTATCNDGKTFYSVSGDHRGACSGHGGVKSWADGSPVRSHTKKTEYK